MLYNEFSEGVVTTPLVVSVYENTLVGRGLNLAALYSLGNFQFQGLSLGRCYVSSMLFKQLVLVFYFYTLYNVHESVINSLLGLS